jgi:hypothetical protein
MSEYTPDRWCVIRIPDPKETIYKVFASWGGGYGGSDSWKLNSGITQAVLVDGAWEFEGYSGSVYRCGVGSYGTNSYGHSVLMDMIRRTHEGTGIDIEILSEDTDWAHLDYDPLQQWIKKGIES